MKAIVRHKYGSPDVLELQEVETPPLLDDQVMIRVHAASVNPLDWHFLRGTPFVIRMTAGLVRPKRKILGADVAGTVEAVAATVTRIQPGDEVFAAGPTLGTFAEYLCVPQNRVVLKPANVTFEEAAAVPVAALTALQGLRDKGHIERGHKVLINGAAGGVGTFAVQIAKSFGAEVTGVCSTRNPEMVGSLGADRVIDYTREDFTKDDVRYDLILDAYGNHSLSEYKRILNPEGMFVAAAGSLLRTLRIALPGSKRMVWFIADPNLEDMTFLKELLETGEVTPVIDRSYPLNEAPDAIRYLEAGHAQGKVIITV
jgi:NADPH:quinone reductase-like Zn-dependent oxidoreductase